MSHVRPFTHPTAAHRLRRATAPMFDAPNNPFPKHYSQTRYSPCSPAVLRGHSVLIVKDMVDDTGFPAKEVCFGDCDQRYHALPGTDWGQHVDHKNRQETSYAVVNSTAMAWD